MQVWTAMDTDVMSREEPESGTLFHGTEQITGKNEIYVDSGM